MSKDRAYNVDLAREAGLPVFRFPLTKEEMELAEAAVQNDLSKLSIEKQEQITFSIHGIPTINTEGDDDTAREFLAGCLKKLDDEIAGISANKKDAYEQALFLNPGYVRDEKFRTLFLRCVDYSPKLAAEKMVLHFDIKRELFGDGEILGREVRQSDLSPESLASLQLGEFQVLPQRDVSGRSVIALCPGSEGLFSKDIQDNRRLELGRSIFYMNTAILRDEHVQKEGLVWIFYALGTSIFKDFGTYEWVSRVDGSCPILSIAGHICFDSQVVRPIIAGYQLFSNQRDRHRMRMHYGASLEELHFTLQTFGIPTEASPMQPDGTWLTDSHKEWLQAQRLIEEASLSSAVDSGNLVVIPRRFDVLFGKNRRARLSTGTQRALHLVEMHMEEYEQANKVEKTEIAESIIANIHEVGGRFLKQDDEKEGCWVEVDDAEARKKVAHWFRHARSKSKQGDKATNNEINRKGGRSWKELVSDVAAEISRPFKRVTPSPSPSEGEEGQSWD